MRPSCFVHLVNWHRNLTEPIAPLIAPAMMPLPGSATVSAMAMAASSIYPNTPRLFFFDAARGGGEVGLMSPITSEGANT